MSKEETKQNPGFLEYVYQLNEGMELPEAFEQSLQDIDEIDIAQLKRIGLNTYAEGKWTIHQIFQHLIDWERVWCFRAVLFARSEGSIPDAHDQEVMAANSNANDLSIDQLIDELRLVRRSSMALFQSFSKQMLEINCRFFEYEMPLSAIGKTIIAHQIHHLNVIKERYLPLDT